MAIVQISRIQHRKGLQQDLPALASAEIGWSLDTRQLYIGNGTISEGAPTEGVTEILTQYSDLLNIGNQYTFKGAQSGYTSQTGPTALTPVTRTLQQKLDDIVNVRDFGAVGDGITDDTAAIQRAIDEIIFGGFALSQPKLRRVIHFPPGVYLITDSIKLPSYTYIVGSGEERTTIQQTSSSAPMFVLKDSSAQIGNAYGTLGATTAKYISIHDFTLEHKTSKNIITLDSCDEIDFFRVTFKGSQTNPSSTSSALQNAIYAVPTNSAKAINGIKMLECTIMNCTQGLVLNAYDVKIVGCDFSGLSRAVWVDATLSAATTRNVKIANSNFDNISRTAIYVVSASATARTNVISVGNYFGTVGGAAGAAAYPVISFTGSGNYSTSDSFARTDADAGVYPRVQYAAGSLNAGLDANVGMTAGMLTVGSGRVLNIAASQTSANTGVVLSGTTGGATIHYVLQRPSASAYRHGKLDVIYNGSNVQYVDEYTEYPNATNFVYPGPTGVTLAITNISAGKFKLEYTSDSAGTGTLTYSITNFQI